MTVYAFDGFELDTLGFELRQGGAPVPMEPQVFRLLQLLVEARDRLVTKDELLDVIWKGRFVSESALSSRIKSARQALGDDGGAQRYIRTVRGEGFRFVGELAETAPAPAIQLSKHVSHVMDRPLIGVFPFSYDREDAAYLVDGLVETLISELSSWRWFPVLSRNATANAAALEGGVIAQAEALKLRYAVCGRIASHAGQCRLTIELIDVASGETLLTESFSDSLGELVSVQPEIASQILRRLAPEIDGAERRRIVRLPQENLSAWDLTLKALWALNVPSPEGLSKALDELETSIQLDPGSALPWSLKARTYFEIGLNGWLGGNIPVARECFLQMLDAARHSIELDPRGWMGHSLASAGELWAQSAYAPARYHAEEALRLNPSAGLAHHFSGCIVGFGGDPAEAIDIQRHVYAVDPDYRHATVIEADLGLWHFLLDDMGQAIHHLDASLSFNPGNLRARQRRIAARSRMGDFAGARDDKAALAQKGIVLDPSQISGSYPFQKAEHGERLAAAMFAPELGD